MEPWVSYITLGVANLAKASHFYEKCLGLPQLKSPPAVAFFSLGQTRLALWSRDSLAADAGLAAEGNGFPGFSLAHNVHTAAEVDMLLQRVASYGAKVTKPAQLTDWGGYAGYFTDLDGFLWEIVYNPKFPHAAPST